MVVRNSIPICNTELITCNLWSSIQSVKLYCSSAGFGALRFFVKNSDDTMVDARRYRTVSPSLATLSLSLSSIRLPNGEAYNFITDFSAIGSITILRKDAFYQLFDGALPTPSYENVLTALRQALAEAGGTSLSINVLSNEECVDMEG